MDVFLKKNNLTFSKNYKNIIRFIFFCFVGFSAFLIDWGFFNIFYYLINLKFIFIHLINYSLHLGYFISITLSAIISMIFNFSVNRNITFSAKGYFLKNQISKWLIIYFISFLARIFSGEIMLIVLGEQIIKISFSLLNIPYIIAIDSAQIAFFIGIIVMIPINFFGSLLWVFKKSN